MTQQHRTSTSAAGITLALALTASTGCSRSAATPAAPTATGRSTHAAAATPSASTPAGQALAAYRAMWADVQLVNQTLTIPAPSGSAASPGTPSYQSPILQQHLDGAALLTIEENLDANEAHGIIGLGMPVLHPTVESASATTVQLRDCMDDTHWLEYYAASHTLVNNIPGGHRYTTATVTDENGTWKVTQLDTRDDGTC
jgi:hypothetical protein